MLLKRRVIIYRENRLNFKNREVMYTVTIDQLSQEAVDCHAHIVRNTDSRRR